MSISTRPVATAPQTAVEQAWAYPLLITLLAVSLGVSGAPAPLYGLYAERWNLAPITTTLVFAVYAFAALGAVLVAGQASDRFGRKPLLVGAAVGMLAGLVVFMTASGLPALFVGRFIHGASVGTAVVVGSAALLDLRPEHGARTGHITGVVFNVGIGGDDPQRRPSGPVRAGPVRHAVRPRRRRRPRPAPRACWPWRSRTGLAERSRSASPGPPCRRRCAPTSGSPSSA